MINNCCLACFFKFYSKILSNTLTGKNGIIIRKQYFSFSSQHFFFYHKYNLFHAAKCILTNPNKQKRKVKKRLNFPRFLPLHFQFFIFIYILQILTLLIHLRKPRWVALFIPIFISTLNVSHKAQKFNLFPYSKCKKNKNEKIIIKILTAKDRVLCKMVQLFEFKQLAHKHTHTHRNTNKRTENIIIQMR